MKNALLFFALLFVASFSFAQTGAPRKFNYQAVPRTASGELLPANTQVNVQFLLSKDGVNNVAYAEEQVLTVGANGVINAQIGGGESSNGYAHQFDALDWGQHSYYLGVAVDLNSDGIFDETEKFPATQLLSVPYALYAEKTGANSVVIDSKTGNGGDPEGTTNYIPKFTGVSTIGNSVMYQSSTNKIGINTTTPEGDLHIQGGKTVLGNGNERFNIALRTDGKVAFEANGTTGDNTLVIDDDGDKSVNIGTATPIAGFKLHVVGKAKFDDGVYFGTTEGLLDGGVKQIACNSDFRPTQHNTYTLGTDEKRWHNIYSNHGRINGSLGVGQTGTINAVLDVIGDIRTGNGTKYITLNGADSDLTIKGVGDNMQVYTGSGNHLLLQSSSQAGTVGIGFTPTNDDYKLRVAGKAKFDDGVYFGSVESFRDGGSFQIATNSNIRPSVDNLRSLGSSTYRWKDVWAVDGTINTSDRRLKKDIQPINYGLSDLMKLNPVSFLWNQEGMDRERRLGFIAQELQPVLKEVVRTEELVSDAVTKQDSWRPTTRLGVAYTEIIPVTVKAIQEQQQIITDQAKEIEVLKAELASLKSDVQAIKAMLKK
ncbi:MAG: tail fiber domain-containing protein [Chitinophagales bacterium]|nr:tail fiber domain-containing protein [Chitinophagales bacterium]